MADTEKRKNVDELDAALRLLDHELSGLALDEPLSIRAIGGYALLKHGIRQGSRAATLDIDTVSKDYSAAVERAIRRVAEIADLEPGWLNNDNVLDNDPEHVENMLQAEWLPQPMDLRNISVSIASVPTLTRSKIMASEDAEFSNRLQDPQDLLDLLDHQGITSLSQFRKLYPDPFEEFPAAEQLVKAHLHPSAPGTPVKPRFPELDDIELDPYGFDNEMLSEDAQYY